MRRIPKYLVALSGLLLMAGAYHPGSGAVRTGSKPRAKPASKPAPPALKAPSGLAVISATKDEVKLRWTGNDPGAAAYVVERKPLGGQFVPVGKAADAEAADTSVNAYATYLYRVRATGPKGSSGPSNQVTVGPPPPGFHTVVPAPDGLERYLGHNSCLALDANDDPVIAYCHFDPNRDSKYDDSQLWVVHWDRAHYRWLPPVLVDTIGQIDPNPGHQVAIARDPSSGLIGVAYQKGAREIWLALSEDNGATWRTEAVHPADQQNVSHPTLAMGAGKTHLAYWHRYDGIRYRSREGGSGEFASALAPLLPETEATLDAISSLALDSEDDPGFAYWLRATSREHSYNVILAFWRPGETAAHKVTDSQNKQNSFICASLAFHGLKPSVAMIMRRTDAYHDSLWFSASADGQSWSQPVLMPKDGDNNWDWPVSLVLNSKGSAAILVPSHGGGGGNKAGHPKLVRSADLVAWRTTSPDPDNSRGTNIFAWYTSAALAGNDKLYAVFQYTSMTKAFGPGVILWREP